MPPRDRPEPATPAGEETLAGEDLGERCAAVARRLPAGDLALELARARARANLLSEPRRIVQLGRYVVLDRIGSGGMGVVYAAFDPQLDRKIALKVLHARTRTSPDGRGARLLREAQALARLTHPNVVTVHDAGTVDDGARELDTAGDPQIYVAMEYVDGVTLTRWLADRRNLRDVVDVMIQAGRGLAAAHAAGLVHRDFKPDNVMVSAELQWARARVRVRVMDFGLARSDLGLDAPTEASDDRTEIRPSATEHPLTTDGAVVGTPAYMAPEQHLGLPTDARSDQFSFCVVLWEAMYGQRPFTADSLAALAIRVTSGRRAPPPAGARVPRWLRRVCERGLATDPAHRFSSMPELLATLERGLNRGRARRAALLASVAAALGLAVVGWRAHAEARRAFECVELGAAITEVWPGRDDTARAAMQAAFVGAAAEDGATTATKVEPWLDAWASAWTTAREQTCRAHQVDGTWDGETRARADECLAERKSELEAFVSTLSRADAGVAWRAVGTAAGLSRVEPCADAAVLGRRPALPIESLDAIATVRESLARAAVLGSAAKYDEGLSIAQQGLADAEEIGWAPLRAQALLRVGVLFERKGENDEAEDSFARAYVEAAKAGALEITADAALNLVFVVGSKSSRHREARVWASAGEVAVAFAEPDAPGPRSAGLWNSIGQVHMDAGELPEARAMHERVLAIREDVLGPTHPSVATSLNNLGNVLHAMGDYAGARTMYERALAIREQVFGPHHPDVAASIEGIAHVELSTGQRAQARASYERALAIQQRALGPDHPSVASTLTNLGNAELALRDLPAARLSHVRALEIRQRAFGPDNLDTSRAWVQLANVEWESGDFATAERSYRRALAIQEQALGPDSLELATPLKNIGMALWKRGELAEAKASSQRALALREAKLGPEHEALVSVLEQLGMIELEMVARGKGRLDDAIGWLERAERTCAKTSSRRLPRVRFELARALFDRDRNRALALARTAREGLAADARSAETLAELDAWLRAHGG